MVTLDGVEVAKHHTRDSCWIVIDNGVYDVTKYLSRHPGGAAVILKQAGSDATAEFRKIHSLDILHHLPKESYLGDVDSSTLTALSRGQHPPHQLASNHESSAGKNEGPPHISHCVALSDFEDVAKKVLPPAGWAYASSYAHSGQSLHANLSSWQRVTFRPRVLRSVASVSTQTTILGRLSALPFLVAPMGALGRAHPGAENELIRGLARKGVHCVLSAESTRTVEEIAASLVEEQKSLAEGEQQARRSSPPSQLHYQLYVPADHSVAKARIRRAKAAGCQSLWVTVDTPVLGKRTIDRRLRAQEALSMGLEEDASAAGLGSGTHVQAGELSPSLSWDDLLWIRKEWGDLPVVLKGIQNHEDARLAVEHGVQGILLSNHGGRQMHSAPDALTTLLEIRRYCPEVLDKLEVYVDGGLRDGADILKAICLGARGVGVGRPFLYALAAYGMEGVERCVDILSDELHTGMRLLGVTSLGQLRPEMVNASRLLNEIWRPERSRL